MNFDTGLVDRLFGRRIAITTDTAAGPKSVWVTEKWFANREQAAHKSLSAPMSLLKDNLARIVALRERWIAINDDTVAPSLAKSLRRILPIPFLFEAIPFRQQANDLASIVTDLDEEIERLERFQRSEFADAYNRNVAAAAIPYARAIRAAAFELGQIKKRMADGLDKVGPSYSWSEYNRDLTRYDSLRLDVSRTGIRLSDVINGSNASTELTEQPIAPAERPEVPIEEAVSFFLNSVRKHVEANWRSRAMEFPEVLPSADAKLVSFAQGDVSEIFMTHAMFAVELRECRRVYPVALAAQVESLTLNTIRANMQDAGEQFATITSMFLAGFDEAMSNDLEPMFAIGIEMANFIQVNSTQILSRETHFELSKVMCAVAASLKQDWWANFASQMKLEVGA
jgi:hypothetical protein